MKILNFLILFSFALFANNVLSADFAGPLTYTSDLQPGGPVVVQQRNVPSDPSPYSTGYYPESKTCFLLVNTAVPASVGIEKEVAIMHEAGHCHELRLGLQDINGGATRYGEGFADVFALAWISKNDPDKFQEASFWLLQKRNLDRQANPAYNTLLIIRRAMISLPSGELPEEFTRKLLGE